MKPFDSLKVSILITMSTMKSIFIYSLSPKPTNTHPAIYKVIFIASRKDRMTRRLIVNVAIINKLPTNRHDISERMIRASARNPRKKIAVSIPPMMDTT
ncbi:hypothetical protein F070042J6_25950 [Bacteroides sp. f07]